MGPILQMRKLRPRDVSPLAHGSPEATQPVKFLPRPSIKLPCWGPAFSASEGASVPLTFNAWTKNNSFLFGL